jgi:uncharacterized protein YwqG
MLHLLLALSLLQPSQPDTPKPSKAAMTTSQQEARALIREELPEETAALAIKSLRPVARIQLRQADDASIPVGSSKYGGDPDVPEGFVWPTVTPVRGVKADGPYPLTFVMQIDFAAAHEHLAADTIWPKDGRLLFFFDALTMPNLQSVPEERNGIKLIYVPADKPLTRVQQPKHPLPTPSDTSKVALPSHSISYTSGWTTPEDLPAPKNLDPDERAELLSEYTDWWEQRRDEEKWPLSFVGGHATSSQEDPESTIAEPARGIFKVQDKAGKWETKAVAPPLPESGGKWRLLFQLDMPSLGASKPFAYEQARFYLYASETSIRSRSFAASSWTWDHD